jgi:hypothetical protein
MEARPGVSGLRHTRGGNQGGGPRRAAADRQQRRHRAQNLEHTRCIADMFYLLQIDGCARKIRSRCGAVLRYCRTEPERHRAPAGSAEQQFGMYAATASG